MSASRLTFLSSLDADTGYGNPLNVMRTVAELERAGVAAIQFEDQVAPKALQPLRRHRSHPTEDMVANIQAAQEASAVPS